MVSELNLLFTKMIRKYSFDCQFLPCLILHSLPLLSSSHKVRMRAGRRHSSRQAPGPGRVARKWPGWARQLTAPPPGLSLSQGWAKSRLGESSPALHLKKSRQARRRQRLEEGLELLRVKCNCEMMVSKYAIGQGERHSHEVNKFSLRILTYHKKESKYSIRTYFYQAFAQTQTSLI